MAKDIDLHAALNAVSDVIANRPRPMREFDQIYMKAGDMVMQSEYVARWADGQRLAFIGDGDAISVCVAYLKAGGVLDYGPSRVTVFDFDERIVNSVLRFADQARIETLDAVLYNVIDPLPVPRSKYDRFYTNPPWGQYNAGESVNVFVQRGMEVISYDGEGLVVVADDDELPWPQQVLGAVQNFASNRGFFVSRMMTRLHRYHLDDAPELRSCNLTLRSLPGSVRMDDEGSIADPTRLRNFYGRGDRHLVRYVREKKRVDYGRASQDEYEIQYLEDTP